MVCDASKEGLGAVLQQKTDEGLQAIYVASRLQAPFERKNSVIELELLAVVRSVEIFINYVYETSLKIVSDYRADINSKKK